MKKRLFLVLLSLCMMVFMAVTAVAAEADQTIDTMDELVEAVNTANSSITVGAVLTVAEGETYNLNLNGCTVNMGANYIENKGTLTISGGTLVAATVNNETNGAPLYNNGGTLTIVNGTYTGMIAALRVNGGDVTIEDGTFNVTSIAGSSNCVIRMKGGNLTVNNGTFTGNNDTNPSEGCSIMSADGGTTVINNGTFSNFAGHKLFGQGTNVTVKGGAFNFNGNTEGYTVQYCLANYLPDGYKVDDNGVVALTAIYVAQIGDNKYESLEEAIKAAQGGDIIDLMGNTFEDAAGFSLNNVSLKNGSISFKKGARIGLGGDVILDNVDLTFDMDGTSGYSNTAIYVNGGSTRSFTLMNGTNILIKNPGYTAIYNDGSNAYDLKIDNSTLTIEGKGSQTGINIANITLTNGAKLATSNTGIAINSGSVSVDGTSTVTVNGTSSHGITNVVLTVMAGGIVDINDCAYLGLNIKNDSSIAEGAKVTVDNCGTSGNYVGIPARIADTVVGYDKILVDNQKIVATGASGNAFTSLAEALAAAKDSDTVTLLDSVTEDSITLKDDVVLDLNGKELTLTGSTTSKIQDNAVVKNGTITINNPTAVNVIDVGGSKNTIVCDVTFENVALTVTNAPTRVIYHDDGTLTFKYSTVIFNKAGENAIMTQANVVIDNSTVTFTDTVRGITANTTTAAVEISDSEVTITGTTKAGLGNGINGAILTVTDSTLTVSGGTGRGITVTNGNVVIDNSTVSVSNMDEAGIGFKADHSFAIQNNSQVTFETVLISFNGDKSPADLITADASSTMTTMVACVNGKYYPTLDEAFKVANDGDTVTLLTDVTLSEILVIDKAITLDGGSNTLTSTAGRAINVNCAGEVTIQNLTIVGGKGCERGINVIQKAGTTNLNNVTVSGVSHYAVNVAATAGAAKLNISNSDLSGYGALTIYGNGSVVEVTDTTLVGENVYADNGSNGFSTISVGAENITITVEGGSVTAKSTEDTAHQGIIGSTGTTGLEVVLDTELVTEGTASIMSLKLNDNTLSFSAEYAGKLMAEGYAVSAADADGLIGITGVAVAKIGDTTYATLADAIAAATDGETITLLSDMTIVGNMTTAGFIDENGYTLTLAANAVLTTASADLNVVTADDCILRTYVDANGNTVYSALPLYNVTFNVLPVQPTIILKDAQGNEITPIAAGKYELIDGTYSYLLLANGFIPKTGTFTVNGADLTLDLAIYLYIPQNTTYSNVIDDALHGDVSAYPARAEKGDTVIITADPDAGYEVSRITVTDKNGKPVSVIVNRDGTFSFTQPASAVTISVTFTEIKAPAIDDTVESIFIDVDEDAYYAEAVLWAVENGITTGTSDITFSPDATCTRAQAVTFLWRAAGSPAPKSTEMPFDDVDEDAYYAKAVLWAVEKGITNGTSDTTFSPDAKCTRAQIVTFLYRSQKSPDAASKNPFTDVDENAYYAEAVLWAVDNKITKGATATTFAPDAECTRAQIVTFLYRCMGEE